MKLHPSRMISVTRPAMEFFQGPDPRRRKFLMALAATLLCGQTFADTQYQDVNPRIADTKPPAIVAITAEPAVIPVANRHLFPVTLKVKAADDVDWRPACRIESVRSNQPSITSAGEDWTIMGPLELYVRAERPSASGHREYTVTVRCTDRAGKTSDAKQVRIPVAPGRRRI